MCYPKPGPRCSAHAIKAYAVAHQKCLNALYRKGEEVDIIGKNAYRKKLDRLVAARSRAEKEFLATPAGLALLESKVKGARHPRDREMAQEDLDNARLLRQSKLAAIQANDEGDKNSHRQARVEQLYAKLNLVTEFLEDDVPRVGWYNTDEGQDDYTDTLIKVSSAWSNRLTPEQLAVVHWYAEDGSNVLSMHSRGEQPATEFTADELDSKQKLLTEALERAPRLPHKVVLYRGINSLGKFDPDSIVQTGEYVTDSVQSATPNPGVANSFGYGGVMLEIKTRSIACTSAMTRHGTKEEEVLLKPGTRYKLVGDIKGKVGWTKNSLIDYRILQLEEIED